VETASAQTAANYVISDGVVVESAVQHSFNKAQVNLTVSPLSGNYEIVIANVKDLVGNVMEPQTMQLSYVGIEDVFANGQINVYPNPVKDQLVVSFNSIVSSDVQASLIDITGKKLVVSNFKANSGDNSFSVDMAAISKGLYFLEVTVNGQSLRYKVIKN